MNKYISTIVCKDTYICLQMYAMTYIYIYIKSYIDIYKSICMNLFCLYLSLFCKMIEKLSHIALRLLVWAINQQTDPFGGCFFFTWRNYKTYALIKLRFYFWSYFVFLFCFPYLIFFFKTFLLKKNSPYFSIR